MANFSRGTPWTRSIPSRNHWPPFGGGTKNRNRGENFSVNRSRGSFPPLLPLGRRFLTGSPSNENMRASECIQYVGLGRRKLSFQPSEDGLNTAYPFCSQSA